MTEASEALAILREASERCRPLRQDGLFYMSRTQIEVCLSAIEAMQREIEVLRGERLSSTVMRLADQVPDDAPDPIAVDRLERSFSFPTQAILTDDRVTDALVTLYGMIDTIVQRIPPDEEIKNAIVVIQQQRNELAQSRGQTFGPTQEELRLLAVVADHEWRPIATAAHDPDLIIEVKTEARHDLAEGVEPLPSIECLCAWHPDAGFCVDDLREVTLWRPAPKWARELWQQLQQTRIERDDALNRLSRRVDEIFRDMPTKPLREMSGFKEHLEQRDRDRAELAELRERTTPRPIEEARGHVLAWDSKEKHWMKCIVLPGEVGRLRSAGYTQFVPLPPPPEGETT